MSTSHFPAGLCRQSDRLILPANEVHVWRADLDQLRSQIEEFYRVLVPDEKERAGRFHFQKDRENFIVSRGLLRKILGLYLGSNPGDLRLQYGSHGKPFLEKSLGGKLQFNLSHSHNLALLAVTRGREVGIDVERMCPQVVEEPIAERFFSAYELATLRSLPVEQQVDAFFNCWTRKEAYIKARGDGLSCPLDAFDVSLKPGEPAALLATRTEFEEISRWRLEELAPGVNFKAALAAERPDWRLRCWQWPR
jgi:4'-phosphopantetheinyl transferase